MNEHEEMRDALAALLTPRQPYPLYLSSTHLLRAGRTRRRRRRALVAAAVAILAGVPVTVFALSAAPQVQVGQQTRELRLVRPEPCRTGDPLAGLPRSQVLAIEGNLRAVVESHRAGLALPAMTPGGSTLMLNCGPRSATRSATVALTLGAASSLDISVTVGTGPVGDTLATDARAGGVSYRVGYDAKTQRYVTAARYGPYCILQISGTPRETGPSYPFRSEVELEAFLLDPQVVDLAVRLAG